MGQAGGETVHTGRRWLLWFYLGFAVAVVGVGALLMTRGGLLGGVAFVIVFLGWAGWRVYRWARAIVRISPDGVLTLVDLHGATGVVDLAALESIAYFSIRVLYFERQFFELTDRSGSRVRLTISRGQGYWTHEPQLWTAIADAGRRSRAQIEFRAGRLLYPRVVPLIHGSYDGRPFGWPQA